MGHMGWNILNTKPVKVEFPSVFTHDTVYALIENLLDSNYDCKHGRVVLDFRRMKKIQVGGIALLSNLIEAMRKARVKVELQNTHNCDASYFLEGSGFSSLYGVNKKYLPEYASEFLRLGLVQYDKSVFYIGQTLIPWIGDMLDVEYRALGTVRMCFEEIFNNISDHSTVDVGCSCAHFDKVTKKLSICVSDIGVGIPAKVRSRINIGSDSAAIAMACQEGFTTQSSPRNMGAGLYHLIKNVVRRNRGTVTISSGSGIYFCKFEGDAVRGRVRTAKAFYPGTIIYITLDGKLFIPDEVEEKFEWEQSEF